jgi:hypothetical protein
MTEAKRKDDIPMIQLTRSCRSLGFALLSVALAVPMFAGTALADAPADGQVAPPADGAGRGEHRGTPVNVSGEVARYLVGPLGHVRGFLLKDGTVVMVHDEAGEAMAKVVPVGQTVRVEGVSPADSGGKMIFRAAVYTQKQGQVVTPPARGARGGGDVTAERKDRRGELKEELEKLPEASANGTVEAVISGRHGRSIGLVLRDGTTVFFRHSLAKALTERGIKVGDEIQSSGKGATYPLGASVLAGSITFKDGTHFEARDRSASPA